VSLDICRIPVEEALIDLKRLLELTRPQELLALAIGARFSVFVFAVVDVFLFTVERSGFQG
jgi:hypothetical protein